MIALPLALAAAHLLQPGVAGGRASHRALLFGVGSSCTAAGAGGSGCSVAVAAVPPPPGPAVAAEIVDAAREVGAGLYTSASRDVVLPGHLAMKLKTDDETSRPKNLLVLIADDFRPAANHSFGMTEISTPHIDRLSETGLTFTNAYSQFQWCSPSRNSFMSGRRPDTTNVYNGINNFRDNGACVKTTGAPCTSWPEHFKNHGYRTAGVGEQRARARGGGGGGGGGGVG
eukprot:SAG22_NODE_3286_length_1804_cov_5.456891_1_plen_228_part_10